MGDCVLITHGVGDCRDMIRVSFPRTWEWCCKHGIGFEGSTRREAPQCNIYWDKIAMIRRILNRVPLNTTVLWMDADCMVAQTDVSPRDVMPEQFALGMRKVVVKASGKVMHNAGVIFMRNTPELQAFFEAVWGMRDNPELNENDEIALNKLISAGFPCFDLPDAWNATKPDDNAIIYGYHTWDHARVLERLAEDKLTVVRRMKLRREA